MNTLYNIMKWEKERNPDMDMYYSEKKKSLQYKNKEGTRLRCCSEMTVLRTFIFVEAMTDKAQCSTAEFRFLPIKKIRTD